MSHDAPEDKAAAQADDRQVGLPDGFVREIRTLLADNYTDRVQELCVDMPAADMADLLLHVGAEERHRLIDVLGEAMHPETLPHLDRAVRDDLLAHMPGTQVASIVGALDSDDAISLVDGLDAARRAEVMRHLSRRVRAAVEEGLTFPEYTAGRLMQRECVAVPQFWTVGKTVDYLRAAAEALPATFHDVFIVDPMHRFIGTVALSRLLCAQRAVKIDTLVGEDYVTVPVSMDQEQIAHLFRRKDLLSAPVVNDDGLLLGVVTIDDVVDVIDEEAEDDFLKLGGVSDSDIFLPVPSTVRARFWWLAVNLATAFLATFVISRFEGEIQKVVALAALMPIVASMGGNAGTQTLAVAVRALATKELTPANAWRTIAKETLVGAVNGLLFGVIMVFFIVAWYGDMTLGLIMGAAMVVNLVAAGLSGAVIPLWLHRAGYDPAHAGAVFLTTVTDVVGFFAFLGLAAWFLV